MNWTTKRVRRSGTKKNSYSYAKRRRGSRNPRGGRDLTVRKKRKERQFVGEGGPVKPQPSLGNRAENLEKTPSRNGRNGKGIGKGETERHLTKESISNTKDGASNPQK